MVDTLKEENSNQETRIQGLELRVEFLEKDVEKNTQDIESNDEDIAGLVTRVTELEVKHRGKEDEND